MNRRQLLISGGSVLALAASPAAAMVAPAAAPFVPPTTNIVHLAGRIGQRCLFTDDDVLQMLGLDPKNIIIAKKKVKKKRGAYDGIYDRDGDYRRTHYERVDQARSLAQDGTHDIYERAQLVIGIKRKLNLHFNFAQYEQIHWLDAPNPHLKGLTFREVMKADLQFAAKNIDLALQA